ncbi:MAG: cytochrome c [Gemmatimonadales bacterium]|nr:cytochrome c [Gemmatimonadales bacterium]
MHIKSLTVGLVFVAAACGGGGEQAAQQEPAGEAPEAAAPAAGPTANAGEQVYGTTCQVCHQPDGTGMEGQWPALAGSAVVSGDPEIPIRIVLRGMSGEMTRNGVTYNGVMTPWGSQLSDEDVANVLTYVRSSWGNSAAEVTAEQVAAVRTAVDTHPDPFTTDELGIK